jgi:uncharacterized cupin superfamily protein
LSLESQKWEILVDKHRENALSKSFLMATPATVDLEPSQIPPQWILSGTPETRSKMLTRSHDWNSSIVVWDCTAGCFKWHYGTDEVILVVSGEAFMTNEKGEERRFGPGDLGYFSAGSSCTWRVPDHIRKVAVLREAMWRPLGFGLKVFNKLLRIVGLAGKSPLLLAVAVWTSWPPQ